METIKDFFTELFDFERDLFDIVIHWLLFLIIFTLGFICVDLVANRTESAKGIVIEKFFQNGESHLINTVNSNGTTGVGVASSSDSYILFVSVGDKVIKVETDKNHYFKIKVKDTITFKVHCGLISGINYSNSL
jgi:hypothetical protein